MAKSFSLKAGAVVAASALVAGLFAVQPAQAADPGDIDTSRTGSIVVHKHQTPATGNTGGNGTLLSPAPNTPTINGVTFSVQKINVNLATNAGWNELKTMTPAQAAGKLTGNAVTQVTAGAGVATFSNLAVGAYLVKETNAPANVSSRAADFIVTVPFPSQAAGGNKTWLYDVHVYPKNAVTERPTKTVNDTSALKAGDKVTWTIRQTLPTLPAGEKFTTVTIRDRIDKERLELVDHSEWVIKINGSPVDHMNTPGIAKGVNLTAPGPSTELTVIFRDAVAAAFNGGDTIELIIGTTVKGGGIIYNKATTIINSPSGTSTTDTNTVNTQWGYFNILKRSAGDNVALKGAVFEVYTGNTCAANTKVNVTPAKLTTGDNGKFAANVLLKAGTYYLKEAQAPLGYVVPTNNCRQLVVAATHTTQAPLSLTIDNEKSTVPQLPLTGSQGQVVLWAVGGLLVVAGLVTFVVLRRRAANAS